MCAILSRFVCIHKSLSWKRYKIATTADRSQIKGCVSLNWRQRRQTCWVLRQEGWRSACSRRRMFAMRVCVALQLPWSFHLRKCGKSWYILLSRVPLSTCYQRSPKAIRYDTIEEFNVDWKAEYSALSSTRSQKKKLKQPTPVPL